MFCLISFLNEICVISGDKPRIYIKKSHEPVQQSSLQKSRTHRLLSEQYILRLSSSLTAQDLPPNFSIGLGILQRIPADVRPHLLTLFHLRIRE